MSTVAGLAVVIAICVPVVYSVKRAVSPKPPPSESAAESASDAPTNDNDTVTATAAVDFYPPKDKGGSQLNNANNGSGEPLNVIVSGLSDPDVLTDDGFVSWARSLGFDYECLYQHQGEPQAANLGDGNGWVNQTLELRQDYGGSVIGTCVESLIGGNHLRLYRQNGPLANSGALFLAVSDEENLSKHHTISPDGYNTGRDKLVKTATTGVTSNWGKKYTATKQVISGLLPPGIEGVNHGIAQDGNVILLTVKRIK